MAFRQKALKAKFSHVWCFFPIGKAMTLQNVISQFQWRCCSNAVVDTVVGTTSSTPAHLQVFLRYIVVLMWCLIFWWFLSWLMDQDLNKYFHFLGYLFKYYVAKSFPVWLSLGFGWKKKEFGKFSIFMTFYTRSKTTSEKSGWYVVG